MLLILATAIVAQAPVPTPAPSTQCQEARRILTGKGETATFRRLTDLPRAYGYAAVFYHNGECVVPVPIRAERSRRR